MPVPLMAAIGRWRLVLGEGTVEQYVSDVRRLATMFGDDVDLETVTPENLQYFFSMLPENTTKPRIVSAVRNIFRFLVRERLLARDPGEGARVRTRQEALDAALGTESSGITYSAWLSPALTEASGTPLVVATELKQIPTILWTAIAREFAVAVSQATNAADLKRVLDTPIASGIARLPQSKRRVRRPQKSTRD